MRQLPHRELRERIDVDGMTMPNGRAEPTDARAWLRVLAELESAGWVVGWTGSPRPATEAALADPGVGVASVRLTPEADLRLYPSWGVDAVWFDVDVRTLTEVGTQRLGDFMRLLGRCTGQPVKLSHEGRDTAFFAGWFPADGTFRWLDRRPTGKEQSFRVGAHVDDVTYPCRLTVGAGGVSLRVGGPWARLLRGDVVVVHRDRPVEVVTARFAVPWQRCAVLLFDEAHRALVLLSRRRCAEVLTALGETTEVQQLEVRHLGQAAVLLSQQQHHLRMRSRRW